MPITDLAVKEKDLVAATQGRGYWILDDLTPLHQIDKTILASPSHLFTPRATFRLAGRRSDEPRGMGTNPHFGVVLRYRLAEEPDPETEVKLRILDENGAEIRAFIRKPAEKEEKEENGPPAPPDPDDPPKVLDTKVVPARRKVRGHLVPVKAYQTAKKRRHEPRGREELVRHRAVDGLHPVSGE